MGVVARSEDDPLRRPIYGTYRRNKGVNLSLKHRGAGPLKSIGAQNPFERGILLPSLAFEQCSFLTCGRLLAAVRQLAFTAVISACVVQHQTSSDSCHDEEPLNRKDHGVG